MTLSIVGRLVLSNHGITRLYGICQDPTDLDSFYGMAYVGGSLKLYKITWPDTIVQLCDTGLAFNNSQQEFFNGVIGQDWQYGVGLVDATLHYCTAFGGADVNPWVTGVKIVDINLSDYSVTVYEWAAAPNAQFGWSRLSWTYDGVGTYFAMGSTGGAVMKKRYGQATGYVYDPGGSTISWCPIDDQSWALWRSSPTEQYWKITATGATPSETALGTLWGPLKAAIASDITLLESGRSTPGRAVTWDDNWVYMLWNGRTATGSKLIAIRKNLASGSYSFVVLSDQHQHDQKYLIDALDIWQTGATGAAGTLRKIWFTAGGFEDKVYCSEVWPPDMDNSVLLDEGGYGLITTTWIATSGEYAYAYHVGGTYYPDGTITKILDTDLISGVGAPSISAVGLLMLWKDKRLFFSGVSGYGRYLWWSQPYEPQALDVGWDGYNTTVFDDEDVTAIKAIEDTVYVGSKKGWMRLRGKTPDHWALDLTLATHGPLNDKAVSVTPFGAIYPRDSGLYLFNGYTSRLFFEKGKGLMENVNWDQLDKMFSLWDGRFYRLYYPSGSATTNDRELIIDLIAGPDNARGTEGDRAASAGWADITTGTIYLGDESGNLLTEGGGTASRDLEITTKEYPAQGLIQAGQFSKLHYDIDCAGASVYVTPVYDGVEKTAILIPTNSSRTRGHILLPKGNAYRVGIKITVSTDQDVKIYEPWVLE